MMDERFEDDMAEISGDGYLMLCQGRQRLFMEGCDASPIDLAAVLGFRASDGAIHVDGTASQSFTCPFPNATEAELSATVEKLNQCLARWRAH